MTSKPSTTPKPESWQNVPSDLGEESGYIIPLREGKNHREDWLIFPTDFPQVVQVTGEMYKDWGDTLQAFFIRNPFDIVAPVLNYIKRQPPIDVRAPITSFEEPAELKVTLVRKGWSHADTSDTSYPVYEWLGAHDALNNGSGEQK